MNAFNFSRIPPIFFGAGKIGLLPYKVKSLGTNAMLVTGGGSLERSGALDKIQKMFKDSGGQRDQ